MLPIHNPHCITCGGYHDGDFCPAPPKPLVSTLWKQCEDERLRHTHQSREEAMKWQLEGDMYGWNFHQGVASGTIEASFIYGRIQRKLEPALNEMAKLLIELRTDQNAARIDAALVAAGYSGLIPAEKTSNPAMNLASTGGKNTSSQP